MKAIRITLLAGVLLAGVGVAAAQPGQPARGPAADITRDQALARADQQFQRLDANRDGRVTQDEMRAAAQARMGQRQERRAERRGQMFERLDANRDGQLSREEFEQGRQRAGDGGQRGMRAGQRGGQMRERMAARLFGEDGVITAEEFRARALQRFERLDANRDGTITAAERRETRQRMREERRTRRQAPARN